MILRTAVRAVAFASGSLGRTTTTTRSVRSRSLKLGANNLARSTCFSSFAVFAESSLRGSRTLRNRQQRQLPNRSFVKQYAAAGVDPTATSSTTTMTPEELFWFDLNGFLVIRGALTQTQVAGLNAAIDAHVPAKARARESQPLKNAAPNSAMAAAGSRIDLGGMLSWEEPVFRELLTHPVLAKYLKTILGKGFRLDHQPLVIVQKHESEGFALHGGPLSGDDGAPQGRFNPELQYRCVNGEPWTSLLAVSVCLCEAEAGDGGFCVLRGSHKLNFAVPNDVTHGLEARFKEHIHQPATKPGDVILFSEATVHGALPWRPRVEGKERRLALLRFAPANMAYGRAYTEEWGAQVLGKCTPAQRAVLQPPFAPRLERKVLTDDPDSEDGTTAFRRSEHKRKHDEEIFGTPYF